MLVLLSPWETSRTSIRWHRPPTHSSNGSNVKRRRDSAENGEQQEEGESSSVAVSFIAAVNKRALARMKAQSSEIDDYIPHLTVTTDHRISVLGRRISSAGDGNTDDADLRSSSSSSPKKSSSSSSPLPPPYREFSALRYNSRPGDATSFFRPHFCGRMVLLAGHKAATPIFPEFPPWWTPNTAWLSLCNTTIRGCVAGICGKVADPTTRIP